MKDKRWPLPRRSGKGLRGALESLEEKRPDRVVVRSWNDFSSGDFAEPNSLDSKRMLAALTKGINRLRVAYAETRQ